MNSPISENPPPDIVDVISDVPHGTGRWNVKVGNETLALLKALDLPDDESRQRVCQEAVAVMRYCVPPEQPAGQETALVIGYVQSGKTMSFTTVTALARDNQYAAVIVLTGTSVPLLEQSVDRLTNDLRLLTRPDRAWQTYTNPKLAEIDNISSALEEWREQKSRPQRRQTLLIFVMKNVTHLRNLNKLVLNLDLRQLPVLVVDDEADQASLNTAVQSGDQSATYSQLLALKNALPHHTYLQYTATPQANLLINLLDVLSPNSIVLLNPGDGYVGGKRFFCERPSLIRHIPPVDVPLPNSPLPNPPASLYKALRCFFLGVASAYVKDELQGNRSMLIHPHQQTVKHSEYWQWARAAKDSWVAILKSDTQDRRDLLGEFKIEYDDLAQTVAGLPSFDELAGELKSAIQQTNVQEVNARARGKTPAVNWQRHFAHVLVGGQAMDRGFTVRGLTVTYMPRPIGVGNADTLQQRARFFGYKAAYIGYCRVFITADVEQIYRSYVEHEEDLRSRLKNFSATGRSLKEWKRAFLLDSALKPTRDQVIDRLYDQGDFADKWFDPKAPHVSSTDLNADLVASNRRVFERVEKGLRWVDDAVDRRPAEGQRHLINPSVSLEWVYKELLTQLTFPRLPDAHNYIGLLLQIKRHLEERPTETCALYLMSSGTSRIRTLTDKDELNQLFQGHSSGANAYPGDMSIGSKDDIRIQMHYLDLRRSRTEPVIPGLEKVPAIAVWLPARISHGWLVQGQGKFIANS